MQQQLCMWSYTGKFTDDFLPIYRCHCGVERPHLPAQHERREESSVTEQHLPCLMHLCMVLEARVRFLEDLIAANIELFRLPVQSPLVQPIRTSAVGVPL